MSITTTITQPVAGELVWKLENGATVPADDASLRKAGYVQGLDAYMVFHDRLTEAFTEEGLLPDRMDLTDCEINVLRYLFETSIHFPTHFTEFKKEMDVYLKEAADIERKLRETKEDDSGQ